MKKIKLLFFHFDLGNGGAERVLVNLANSLNIDKYDIEIRTLFNYGPNINLINTNVKYSYAFNCKPFRGSSILMKLLPPKLLHKIFIKKRYDIEIAFREGSPTRIVSGCNEPSTKKYAWIHTTLIDKIIAAKGYRDLDEFNECCKKFDGIAAVSNVVKQSVEQWLPHNIKISTIYNVIEPEKIKRQANNPIDIKINTENTINLITVGRLTSVKSFDRLIKVLDTIKRSGVDNWHLYIIGIGEMMSKLKEITTSSRLESHITFLGYQENPHKYVSRMDLYVCSSLIEGFSTAVTEAIINGIPVLTTECAGMSEIIGDTKAGLIVENTEDGIHNGLINILKNPNHLQLMRKEAEKRASFFSKENSIKQFEDFINS